VDTTFTIRRSLRSGGSVRRYNQHSYLLFITVPQLAETLTSRISLVRKPFFRRRKGFHRTRPARQDMAHVGGGYQLGSDKTRHGA
jgi:hypothetical protein